MLHAQGQRAIDPHRVLAFEEIAPDQIRCREVFATGHGDQRPAEPKGHVLDEARFPATSRPLEHDRHAALGGGGEQPHFPSNVGVVGLLRDAVLSDVELAPGCVMEQLGFP